MVAGAARFQFFAEKFWPTLVEVGAYSGNFVGQDSIVFRKACRTTINKTRRVRRKAKASRLA